MLSSKIYKGPVEWYLPNKNSQTKMHYENRKCENKQNKTSNWFFFFFKNDVFKTNMANFNCQMKSLEKTKLKTTKKKL